MSFILNFTHSREYSYCADRYERCANRTAFNVDFPHSLFKFTKMREENHVRNFLLCVHFSKFV